MARIYEPKQLLKDGQPSGLWHMTVKSDEEKSAHAVGACAEDCPGHPTSDEAQAHFDEGEARDARYDRDPDEQRRCGICGEWTRGRAMTAFHTFVLCGQHGNRENVHYLLIAGRTEHGCRNK